MNAIEPRLDFIDLTHQIPPQDCLAAALQLQMHYSFFPKGSVFLVVVDPGVGSSRKALIAQTESYQFVAPDNGVLDLILKEHPAHHFLEIQSNSPFLPARRSATFHGRDLFAPVAAHLAKGTEATQLGSPTQWKPLLEVPEPQAVANGLIGQILLFDTFGNALTNFRELPEGSRLRLSPEASPIPFYTHFAAAPPKILAATKGSAGYIELFVREAHAKQEMNLQKGQSVYLQFS